ncbi:UNVERIFIED_CONTAM: hypothetical protein Sradi_2017700 [Sesamum radiatum]|uniref:Uncharacterized protein n=1 Tax=Sesamum radiatum TaxID=300843 RepID=A0AAW2TGJ5_SESRA
MRLQAMTKINTNNLRSNIFHHHPHELVHTRGCSVKVSSVPLRPLLSILSMRAALSLFLPSPLLTCPGDSKLSIIPIRPYESDFLHQNFQASFCVRTLKEEMIMGFLLLTVTQYTPSVFLLAPWFV